MGLLQFKGTFFIAWIPNIKIRQSYDFLPAYLVHCTQSTLGLVAVRSPAVWWRAVLVAWAGPAWVAGSLGKVAGNAPAGRCSQPGCREASPPAGCPASYREEPCLACWVGGAGNLPRSQQDWMSDQAEKKCKWKWDYYDLWAQPKLYK